MSADRWARVKEVFHEALTRDGQERRALLDSACATDDELRSAVERLLAADEHAGAFIEPPPAGMTGRRMGRYDVGRLLGAGGMGEVYAAHDVELDRDVALKIALSPDYDSQLRKEAQRASRLNHPHICTVHEVGALDGRVYVVMEYVEGQSLSDLISRDGLPIDAVIRHGIQIADAIGYAHRHGVIHCDLKAANVMVGRDDRAKVLDFGLARRMPPQELNALTDSHTPATAPIAGTLSSMAPELLRGEQADARSDIWAFGVLLHEMVTGSQPFTGATGFEVSAAIFHKAPAPLPARVPPPLRKIILRCLEKLPDERYQSAEQITSALEAMRADRSSAWATEVRPPRSDWRSVAAAVVALGLAAAGAGLAWHTWSTADVPAPPNADRRPAVAVMPFDHLADGDDTSWLPKAVHSMLLTGLAQTPGLAIVSMERLHEASEQAGNQDLVSLDRAAVSTIARRAGAGIAVVGTIVTRGGSIRIDAQVADLSSARVLAATSVSGSDVFLMTDQLAVRIRDSVGFRNVVGVRPITEVSSGSLEAYRLYSEGVDAFVNVRLTTAKELLEQAVAVDPAFADAYLQLALLSGPSRRPGDRSLYLRKAAEHRQRLSEPRRLLMEVELARDEGRFSDAARGLDELLAKFPDLDAISTLAWQLHAPVVAPLSDSDKLLSITSRVSAANPSSPLARNTYAYALLSAGRFAEAIRELETYATLAPREPNPYDGLGDAYMMMGQIEKALESYSRSLTIDSTFSSGGRARALGVLGRFDEALLDKGAPPFLSAVLLARVGRYREARLTIAAAERAAASGGDLAALGGVHLLSALLRVELQQYSQARADVRSAATVLAKLPSERQRFSLALLHMIGGVAELRSGDIGAAQRHFTSQGRVYPPEMQTDQWWHHTLGGEIALATGKLEEADAAFKRSGPSRRQLFTALIEGSVLANDLVFRDGPARLLKARRDLRGAIEIYRRLLNYGPGHNWVAVFEPRYLLEIARLLEQTGDLSAAREEYGRFLDVWKDADPDLPELIEARRAIARR